MRAIGAPLIHVYKLKIATTEIAMTRMGIPRAALSLVRRSFYKSGVAKRQRVRRVRTVGDMLLCRRVIISCDGITCDFQKRYGSPFSPIATLKIDGVGNTSRRFGSVCPTTRAPLSHCSTGDRETEYRQRARLPACSLSGGRWRSRWSRLAVL